MSAAAPLDPHNNMRARDITKVARGEQAPRPPHQYGTVSSAPPPASVNPSPNTIRRDSMQKEEKENEPAEQPRHCYATYVEYQRCLRDRGKDNSACHKLASHCSSLCRGEWIERWDQQRENGTFPQI